MPRVEHDIYTLAHAQELFYLDRPTMGAHNAKVPDLIKLLSGEIRELNGHATDGMSRELYRYQEIADVFWFAMAFCKQLGGLPTPDYLEEIRQSYGFKRAEPGNIEPVDFADWQEEKYWQIKAELEKEVSAIEDQEFMQNQSVFLFDPEQRDRLMQHVYRIIGLTWVLFDLLQVDPPFAVSDKMARNQAKHTAGNYQRGSYAAAREKSGQEFGERRLNEQYYEPLNPEVTPAAGPAKEIELQYRLLARGLGLLAGAIWQGQVLAGRAKARLHR